MAKVQKSLVEKIIEDIQKPLPQGKAPKSPSKSSLEEHVEEMEEKSHKDHWEKFREASLKASDTWILRYLRGYVQGNYKGVDRHYIRRILKGAYDYCLSQRELEQEREFWSETIKEEVVENND